MNAASELLTELRVEEAPRKTFLCVSGKSSIIRLENHRNNRPGAVISRLKSLLVHAINWLQGRSIVNSIR